MAVGRPMGAKLLLEGVEVPFIGASITHTVNQASIAYVDLVPHKLINNIKPRTLVHILVRDFTDKKNNYPYVLAWEGEVFGYSLGKTSSSRTFSLQCIDLSGYWDNVLAFFMNTMQSSGKVQDISNLGTDLKTARKNGFFTKSTSLGLRSFIIQTIKDTVDKNGKDLLDGLVEVYKQVAVVNDFYKLAEKRLRIVEKLALNSSQNLEELFTTSETEQFLDWLEGIVGKKSGYSTLRTVIQELLGVMFHDYVTMPFPSRVESGALTGDKLTGTTTNKKQTIGSFVFKPNTYMIPPPACNIFFPDEYSSFQFQRNYFSEPTRLNYRPELPRYLDAGLNSLPFVFEPDSYEAFMVKRDNLSDFSGSGLFDANTIVNKYLDNDKNDSAKTNNGKVREGQFLTNEEAIKGIWMANETLVPATTQFRKNLKDQFRRPFAKKIARYLFFKKRFQDRGLQITSHLKLSVAPGFTVLILDDSDADYNMVAYCSSVTHRIYATQGGYTNTTLSYARLVDEQDVATNRSGEPIVPPWFADDIFGKLDNPPESKCAKDKVAAKGVQHVSTKKLSDFYKNLLGDKGSKAVTNMFDGEVTLTGSVCALLDEYRQRRSKGSENTQDYISEITRRDYVRARDAMGFIGATTKTKDLRDTNFVQFDGSQIQAKGESNEDQIADKRNIVINYRNVLNKNRGFRG